MVCGELSLVMCVEWCDSEWCRGGYLVRAVSTGTRVWQVVFLSVCICVSCGVCMCVFVFLFCFFF